MSEKSINSNICLYVGGYCYDFERFTQKTLRGVLDVYRRMTKEIGLRPLFFESYWHADRIEFRTLVNNDKYVVSKIFTPKEFMAEIGWNKPAMKTRKEYFKDSWVIRELTQKGLIKL